MIKNKYLFVFGSLCVFLAIFSDVLRGRTFFLGLSQIILLICGIILVIASFFYPYLLSMLNKFTSTIFTILTKLFTLICRFTKRIQSWVDKISEKTLIHTFNDSILFRRIWKVINLIGFSVIYCLLLKEALYRLTITKSDPWRINDWLINYQGGFVRRGAIGEFLLWISNSFDIEIGVLVIILQMVLYLVFFYFTYRLVILSYFSPLNIALLYSPAFMLFTVNDLDGGFRKEILFFSFFSWLCYYLATHRGKIRASLYIAICICSIVITLSHEMLLVYLPYIFCVLLVHQGKNHKSMWLVVGALAPAFIAGLIVLYYGRGNEQIVQVICSSLSASEPINCTIQGAIYYLSEDLLRQREFVVGFYSDQNYGAYVVLAVLSSLPLLLFFLSKPVRFFIRNQNILLWFLLGIISAILSNLPIFLTAIDYGRFINIHMVALTLIAFVMNTKVMSNHIRITIFWFIGLIIGLFFIFGWQLNHFNATYMKISPILTRFLN